MCELNSLLLRIIHLNLGIGIKDIFFLGFQALRTWFPSPLTETCFPVAPLVFPSSSNFIFIAGSWLSLAPHRYVISYQDVKQSARTLPRWCLIHKVDYINSFWRFGSSPKKHLWNDKDNHCSNYFLVAILCIALKAKRNALNPTASSSISHECHTWWRSSTCMIELRMH